MLNGKSTEMEKGHMEYFL